jgi:oligopeptide/dipeptide ABC transporter ATP-binding protein
MTTDPANSNDALAAGEPILRVMELVTSFKTDRGQVTAVDKVSFDLFPGETLGIVGESGCGKTVTSKSIIRLLPDHVTTYGKDSRIEYRGQNLLELSEWEMREIRGNEIAMIFQEPMTALNPVFTIGWQIDEALKYHTTLNKTERRAKAVEMLKLVEMPNPEKRVNEYPHQLSGGMRQRVVIAIALCCNPEILLADEPTTALDVTIQAQILRLMDNLKSKTGTAIILVTHDLGVVAQSCDRVLVMYAGQVVEIAPVRDIFHSPQHPYTKALLDSMPKPGAANHQKRLPAIEGMVPSLFNLPEGCRFNDRCPFKQEKCSSELPPLVAINEGGNSRATRCFFPLEGGRS